MSFLAVILVLLSAFMHAGWNLLSKSRDSSASFFLVACLSGALLFSPTLVLYGDILTRISARVWVLLLLTGFFQALYYISLASAYRAGDISVAYPITRSAPVILVVMVTLILGRGDQVSAVCIAGTFLVVAGGFFVPLRRFTDFHLKNYLNPTCGFALLAGAGVFGYSMLDDEALRQLRTSTYTPIGNTRMTLLYMCLEALTSALWISIFVAVRRGGRLNFKRTLHQNFPHAVLAGWVIHLTYVMILLSLAFVNNVAYVVGFRQISIPLGALLGILVLKETAPTPKVTGIGIMFVGLVMVAVG